MPEQKTCCTVVLRNVLDKSEERAELLLRPRSETSISTAGAVGATAIRLRRFEFLGFADLGEFVREEVFKNLLWIRWLYFLQAGRLALSLAGVPVAGRYFGQTFVRN